jgi:hypothetical protein
MSAEVSGGTSGGFKICMYGKSGGFASRPSFQPKIHNKILIFLSLRVGRRVTCETTVHRDIMVLFNNKKTKVLQPSYHGDFVDA